MVNREALISGTRPEVGNKILMTAGDHFDGYQIVNYNGMVWGISIRSKDVGTDFFMGIKQFFGGELTSFSELADEGRQKAIDRMLDMARRIGANALINLRFSNENTAGLTEVTVYATAVVIKPIQDYVPTGAIGNILADMADLSLGTAKYSSVHTPSSLAQQTSAIVQESLNETSTATISKTKYPLASLKINGSFVFVVCPECKTMYNTSHLANNVIEVKGYTDYDSEIEGQQIKCDNCKTVFTVPEIDNKGE